MIKRIGIAAALLSLCLSANAKKLRVNNAPNMEDAKVYTTLQNAIMDAGIGDTIYLEPTEQAYGNRDAFGFNELKIDKQVTIMGAGYYLNENKITENKSGETFIGGTVRLMAPNITLNGLILSSVRVEADNVTLQRCQVLNGSSTAIKVLRDANGFLLQQCFVVGDIDGQNYPHNAMFTNSIICGSISTFERCRVEHNTFGKYNRFGTVKDLRFSSVIENIMENLPKNKLNTTAFVNNYTGDFSKEMEKADFTLDVNYKIKLTSPLSTKSSDGGPLGAFGGALPYVVSGLPDQPVISKISSQSTVTSVQGLPVTITYKIDK